MKMLESAGIAVKGADAVVIGRSNIVGKPMAVLLTNAGATVTVCHSQTRDLAAHTRRADIVIAAVGRPRFVTGDMVKPGAAVIDVGINRIQDGPRRASCVAMSTSRRSAPWPGNLAGARRGWPDDHHHVARQHDRGRASCGRQALSLAPRHADRKARFRNATQVGRPNDQALSIRPHRPWWA